LHQYQHDKEHEPWFSFSHPCSLLEINVIEQLLKVLTMDISAAQRKNFASALFRIIVTAHIALACGWLSMTGFPGFARASDVEELRHHQIQAALEVISQSIFDTRVRWCQATTGEAKRFYAEKSIALQQKFAALQQRDYGQLPDCREL
jgi:hypothetical protein